MYREILRQSGQFGMCMSRANGRGTALEIGRSPSVRSNVNREVMPEYRPSAALATAMCAMACAMGGTAAAHAESAAQPKRPPIHSVAGRPAPPTIDRTGDQSIRSDQVCGPPYVTGDPDLGPVFLPRTGYLGALLHNYVPLGGLSPQHFLIRYWDYTTNDYRFPPNAGFATSGNYPNGRLLVKTTFLQIGMKIDRFGGNGGSFLSPMGDLFIWRALTPRNLNTNPQDPTHLCNYHAFQVLKSFRVDVGPAAPAFQQPGGGTQYHVLSKYIPEAPQTNPEVPVSWLLEHGYLAELASPTRICGIATISTRPHRAGPRGTTPGGKPSRVLTARHTGPAADSAHSRRNAKASRKANVPAFRLMSVSSPGRTERNLPICLHNSGTRPS
ncbi:TNT domain-containing protein [Sphaerisporangium melleum]|nr:TNT domain-containing protein [Sphaerisporangium melleum]